MITLIVMFGLVWTDMSFKVTPLQTQIQLLQAELQQRPAKAADLDALTVQVRLLQSEVELLRPQAALVPQLQTEVQQLKEMVSLLTQASVGNFVAPSEKSLGKARASYVHLNNHVMS